MRSGTEPRAATSCSCVLAGSVVVRTLPPTPTLTRLSSECSYVMGLVEPAFPARRPTCIVAAAAPAAAAAAAAAAIAATTTAAATAARRCGCCRRRSPRWKCPSRTTRRRWWPRMKRQRPVERRQVEFVSGADGGLSYYTVCARSGVSENNKSAVQPLPGTVYKRIVYSLLDNFALCAPASLVPLASGPLPQSVSQPDYARR